MGGLCLEGHNYAATITWFVIFLDDLADTGLLNLDLFAVAAIGEQWTQMGSCSWSRSMKLGSSCWALGTHVGERGGSSWASKASEYILH